MLNCNDHELYTHEEQDLKSRKNRQWQRTLRICCKDQSLANGILLMFAVVLLISVQQPTT